MSFDLSNYNLIGIGDFSHGIQESWEFRFELLKYAVKNKTEHIFIFSECSVWQAENVMNGTYYDQSTKKFIKTPGIRIEKEFAKEYVGGKLWQYVFHAYESKIFYKIMKYIRANKDRITLIGIDNDKIDRDYDMYKIIMKNLNKQCINFLWASNAHVDALKYGPDNLDYITNVQHCYFVGHYLKAKLGNKYCIILSQAYQGENRFNGYCKGVNCRTRTFQLKYIYKKFRYEPHKKYVDLSKKAQLLTTFDNKLIEFSNSYFEGYDDGRQYLQKINTWDFILFWNQVTHLKPYFNY